MRKFRIRTCSSTARAAPVPPPEGPEEAAEGWSAQIAFQKMFLGGDAKIAGLALKALPV